MSAVARTVVVPGARWPRWWGNFAASHGPTRLGVVDGALRGDADDGAWFVAHLPLGAAYDGPATADAVAGALPAAAAAALPADWGVLLVRRGGFAVARLAGETVTATKTGSRHVQGRTAAGGQSQQRFARRRAGQARVAFEAAAEVAARLLDGLGPVARGGDREAVEAVLADPRLRRLEPRGPWLEVAEPRRVVLDAAVDAARALRVEVANAPR